ncbi:hypothetical protein BGX28_009007 [Mortierella sp. GBA30]|nr:hypothetical protein BGX28_009007 [Mortierella sp. GBA30]
MVDRKRKLKARKEWVEETLEGTTTQELVSSPSLLQDGDMRVDLVTLTADVHINTAIDKDSGERASLSKIIAEAEETMAIKKRKVDSPDSDQVDGKEESKTTGLSKKERKMLKKKTKQFAKKSEGDNGRPSFMLSRDHGKLSIKDLRDLVVYLLTETPTLPWIMVRNKFNIQKVVLLYVSGLDPQLFNIDLEDPESRKPIAWAEKATAGPVTEFQQLRKFFDVLNVIKAGGDKHRIHSPPNTLLNVPLSNSEKQKREKELRQRSKDAKNHSAEKYMLKFHDLRECDYPLPSYLDPDVRHGEDCIETRVIRSSDTPVPKKMIAMDCEMVRTTVGSELTRVTLVDEEGKAIYDQLVLPDNPVVDYLTQYSGMTAERLEGVTTRLIDVQKKLLELVTYDTILVGHSLENDMKVLKFAHPFIIDTAIAYHHTRGPPFRPSLKWLAQKWLSRKIQTGGELGHDSEEDAQTCMDLVKLKVEKGPGFGEYNQDQESIFSRLSRHTKPRTSAFIDLNHHSGEHATTIFKPVTDAEVVEAIPEALLEHDFVWARLRNMEINHGKIAVMDMDEAGHSLAEPSQAFTKVNSADKVQAAESEIREAIQSVDRSIAQIVESLPPNTALLVTSGQGDHREVSKMQARQKKFQKLYNTLNLSAIPREHQFLDEDQKALEKAVDRAKNGVCFFMVK